MNFKEFSDLINLKKQTERMEELYDKWEKEGILTDTALLDKDAFEKRNKRLNIFDSEYEKMLVEAADKIKENPGFVRYVNMQYYCLFTEKNGDIPFVDPCSREDVQNLAPAFALLGHMDETDEKMTEMGICESIRTAVHRSLYRAIKLHIDQKGFPAVDSRRFFWNRHYLVPEIFPIGELEFEKTTVPSYLEVKGCESGDPIISVHIPAGAKLDEKSRDEAYTNAVSFFKTYFPEWSPKAICCFTWMLDPKLKELLPESSKIIQFQNDYELFEIPSDGKEIFTFVFSCGEVPYEQLPENTSLERALKKLYMEGGQIRGHGGIYKK